MKKYNFWKFFLILKEIKKPSGKFSGVWAKNQVRFEILKNFLIYIQQFQWKIDFLTHFLSHPPGS